MEGQAEADTASTLSSSTIPGSSPVGQRTKADQIEVRLHPSRLLTACVPEQTEVHIDGQDFIDLETIIPQTLVKQTTPVGLIKNTTVTTLTSTKAFPNTFDRQLSAAGHGMAGLDLSNTQISVFSPHNCTLYCAVGSIITGNAGSGHAGAKKSFPIKREGVNDG